MVHFARALGMVAATMAILGMVMLGFRVAVSGGGGTGLRRLQGSTSTTTSTTTSASRCGPVYNLPIPNPPMCTPCRSPFADVPTHIQCQINTTNCDSVLPGQNCSLVCAEPYLGEPVHATCKAGNSNPAQPLEYMDLPTCGCPVPAVIPPAYVKNETSDEWVCNTASFFAGKAYQTCECGQQNILRGCNSMVPCAAPLVDECRYDVDACGNVASGETCVVKCKPPFTGGPTIATCAAENTNGSRELLWMPLRCSLDDCADPPSGSIPQGYLPKQDGWECDTVGPPRFHGKPRKLCTPGSNWHDQCTTIAEFEGCDEVVRCVAPVLSGLDYCMFDVQTCTIDDNSTCKVHCKSPFRGVSTVASCPLNNVLPNGLEVTYPTCWLDENACADPEVIPTGYVRMAVGWACALGYSGSPVKSCFGTATGSPFPDCGTRPVMSGCVKRVPCEYEKLNPPADACRYDMYECASVPDGQSCEIRCKAPFSGDTSIATCVAGNTDPGGLEWTPPACNLSTCIDPYPVPAGYRKTASRIESLSWACEVGYTGTAVKTCHWNETLCSASPSLSGCVKETACKMMPLTDQQQCLFNASADCSSVASGLMCEVGCKRPYMGAPVMAVCPPNNLDPNMSLVWEIEEPKCDCPDPVTTPLGYEKVNGKWQCAAGYVGSPKKDCMPAVQNNCIAVPRMIGCSPPVPCAVQTPNGDGMIPDDDTRPDMLSMRIPFGPAVADGIMSEDDILEYFVSFADSCDSLLGEPLQRVPKGIDKHECCFDNVYEVRLDEVDIPAGATQIKVMVETTTGPSPVGRSIQILDVGTVGKATNSGQQRIRPNVILHAFLMAVMATLTELFLRSSA